VKPELNSQAVYLCTLEQDLIMGLQVFKGVQCFRYLGNIIHSKKLINVEIV
jgi:hypothetical protein